jgi:hypothetical protein
MDCLDIHFFFTRSLKIHHASNDQIPLNFHFDMEYWWLKFLLYIIWEYLFFFFWMNCSTLFGFSVFNFCRKLEKELAMEGLILWRYVVCVRYYLYIWLICHIYGFFIIFIINIIYGITVR